jgi:hypothetical protein
LHPGPALGDMGPAWRCWSVERQPCGNAGSKTATSSYTSPAHPMIDLRCRVGRAWWPQLEEPRAAHPANGRLVRGFVCCRDIVLFKVAPLTEEPRSAPSVTYVGCSCRKDHLGIRPLCERGVTSTFPFRSIAAPKSSSGPRLMAKFNARPMRPPLGVRGCCGWITWDGNVNGPQKFLPAGGCIKWPGRWLRWLQKRQLKNSLSNKFTSIVLDDGLRTK